MNKAVVVRKQKKKKAPSQASLTLAPKTYDVEFDIHEFDPSTIRPNSTILIAGGRRTGKSFCGRDIIYHLRKRVYDCSVYTGTRDPEHPFEKYTPEKYVTYVKADFPGDKLQEDLERQELRKALAEKHGIECPSSMIVFEDLEFLKKSMWKQQSIREVMFNGRWKKVFAVAMVQYLMQIDMAVRGMNDYAIFTSENSAAVRERIWKQFAGVFRSFQEFESVFLKITEDHRVMVVDCRSGSPEIGKTIFYYKAKERGFFHIGVPEVWDISIDQRNLTLVQKFETSKKQSIASTASARKTQQTTGRNKKSVGVKLK